MKVALSVWNNRVSPVFDASRHILIVEVVDGEEKSREEHSIEELFPPIRARRIKELGIDLLICGAISNPVACLIDSIGIRLLPWVSGEVEEVIDVFKRGELAQPRYLMPGCRGRGRRVGRGWIGGGRHKNGRGGYRDYGPGGPGKGFQGKGRNR
jgi:predicted Fe-Mo cluster-binding NifX family protein